MGCWGETAQFSTVHVIDDDEALRESIREVTKDSGYLAATYGSALDFLGMIGDGVSGCVVTDVRLPGMSGIELLAHLSKVGVDLPVIVVTGYADVQLAVEAMKLGAVDLLEKPFPMADLLAAIESALRTPGASSSAELERKVWPFDLGDLTEREVEVFRLVVSGLTNKKIAHELGISDKTVEGHRAKVMRKTGAKNLADLHRITQRSNSGNPVARS